MQTPPTAGSIGYLSSFVEIFAWITTMPAYEALWEILCPSVNPYGWGYDLWYNGHARATVPGHRMGIISSLTVQHEQKLLPDGTGRTDDTKVDIKWKAVVKQERHYKKYLGIDLKKYKDSLELANNTWSGAVKGYLY